MERVRLRVVLDEPDRVFTQGDAVTGRIEVEVDEAVTCAGVDAVLRWSVVGDANSAEGESEHLNLGSGEWKGGDRFSFPFGLPVPAGPPSYSGRRFTVIWNTRVEARLDWAVDPSVEVPIRVDPQRPGDGSLVEKKEAGGFELGCAVSCTVILLVCLAVLFLSRRFAGFGWVIVGSIAGLGALVMIPNAIARRRLGEVLAECGPSPVAAGEEFAVRLVVHPRRRLVPKKVRVTLEGVERSVKGSGKSKSTRVESLTSMEAALEGPEAVEEGKTGEWAGIVRVPDVAAPSLEAGPHSVKWTAKFVIDQDWLPEAEWAVDVRVA